MSFLSKPLVLIALLAPLASGCDLIPDPAAEAAKQEAEAAAVGAGCRQSGRSIEQCLLRNERLSPKAGVLKGWREMDDYMRSNKIEPQTPPPEPKPERKKKSSDEDSASLGLEDEPEPSASEEPAEESDSEAGAGYEAEGASDGSSKKHSAKH